MKLDINSGQISCDLEGNVRLFGGPSEFNGRVEICHGDVWGTVCDNEWDDLDASVVCRQMGHSNVGKLPRITIKLPSPPLFLARHL